MKSLLVTATVTLSLLWPSIGATAPVLDGLYRAMYVVRMSPGAMPAKVYRFFRDGRVCKGLPKQPAGTFAPASCGKYRIAGGRIQFIWEGGASNSSYFHLRERPNGEAEIDFDSAYWYKLAVPSALSPGRYESSPADLGIEDGSSRFPNFAKASGLSIDFSSGGRFAVSHFGRTASGRYELVGDTLCLNFADGETRYYSLHVPEEDAGSSKGQRRLLLIDGRPYFRP
jgi:hypothetical protein